MGAVTAALVAGVAVLGSATAATAANAATTYAVTAIVPVSAAGDGLAVDTANNSLYVSRPSANLVSVVDLTTNLVTDSIPVGGPGRIAIDTVAERAYVVSAGNTVTVIDTSSNTVVDTIPGFSQPVAVAVDPSTHLVYVTNYTSQLISVVDPTATPATITNTGIAGSRPWAIAVDPTTHLAYASTLFGDTVAVVSGTDIVTSIGGFVGPIQVELDPSAQVGYVTNNNSDSISEIDTSTETNIGTFTAGSGPSDLAVDPGTDTLFVTNRNDDSVSVIDQATNTVVGTVSVGYYPVAVEVDPVTHLVYVANSDNTISVLGPFASQEITFTSLAPATANVGDSYLAMADGGGSGNPVTFSTASDACTVTSDGQVDFTQEGACVVAAHQAGDSAYADAPTVTQQIAVSLNPTSTSVMLPTSDVVYGQAATATVAISGTADGSVQFTLDGTPFGSPVAVAPDGTATSPDLVGSGLAVGAHPVGAVFTPTDGNQYAGSSAVPQTLTVSPAATTSSVSVDGSHLTVTVTPTAPGVGVPTGTVRFYLAGTDIGTAALAGGTATLAYSIPTGSTQHVSTVYAGDASFTGSSASTARTDPVITATVSSARAPRNGWYSAPVTVTFHCQQTGGPLTRACPAPVTLSNSAGGQSVTRTIIATDGGAATVVVNVNIDRVRPVARVTGVRAGATYFASGPVAGCRAKDRLSGIASCTVKRRTRGHRVVYVATATDRAGNRSTTRLVARTTAVAIDGARMRHGHYVVHRGRTYTLLVAATTRPSYIYAAPSPLRPAGGVIPFKRIGKNRWALGVTFEQSMNRYTWWNIGTRVGTHTTVTKVRVVR